MPGVNKLCKRGKWQHEHLRDAQSGALTCDLRVRVKDRSGKFTDAFVHDDGSICQRHNQPVEPVWVPGSGVSA